VVVVAGAVVVTLAVVVVTLAVVVVGAGTLDGLVVGAARRGTVVVPGRAAFFTGGDVVSTLEESLDPPQATRASTRAITVTNRFDMMPPDGTTVSVGYVPGASTLAGCGQRRTISRSIDGGRTWELLTTWEAFPRSTVEFR
jgi:hypothetical protein